MCELFGERLCERELEARLMGPVPWALPSFSSDLAPIVFRCRFPGILNRSIKHSMVNNTVGWSKFCYQILSTKT